MKIATWNVNSVRQRILHLTNWLKETQPDVVLLQEIKCEAHAFPYMEVEELGYNIALVGQKTFNGVAVLSKHPIEVVEKKLPGEDADEQARYIECIVSGPIVVRVVSVYVPNGGEIESDKWQYKLRFYGRLKQHLSQLLKFDEVMVIGGDYNVAPEPIDVFDPKSLEGTTCYHPKERAHFNEIINLGIIDAYRVLSPSKQQFTWWDYRAGAWQYNKGMRIDHMLLSPEAADLLVESDVDMLERGREKASDHVPVWVKLKTS